VATPPTDLIARVWVLDDRPDNCAMVERSFLPDVRARLDWCAFYEPEPFLKALAKAHGNGGSPDFILLDYFLGYAYGHEVLKEMQTWWTKHNVLPAQRPIVIAFSSAPDANRRLVKLGADFAIEKCSGRANCPEITALFSDADSIAALRRQRHP